MSFLDGLRYRLRVLRRPATYDRELDEGLEEGAQQTLKDIDDALRKIENGSYGTCEVCGKAIAPERLAAIPWARLCIDDQRKADA